MLELSIWPWLACAICIYAVNLLLLPRDVSMNFILILNVIATVGLCTAGIFLWSEAANFVNDLFIIVFFAISGGRSGYLARSPVHPNQMLLYTEVCILFLALILWGQSVMPEISKYNGVLFGALCVDLIALILIRLVTENQTRVSGSKFQGVFIIGAIVIVVGTLVLGIMMLLSDGVRDLFGGMVTGVVGGLGIILQGVYRGIMFFFSLIPQSDSSGIDMMEQAGGVAVGGEELGPADLGHLLPAFLVLLIVGAGLVFLYTVVKARKQRLSGRRILRQNRQGIAVKYQLWDQLKAFFRRIKKRIIFEMQYLWYRNTPQGIYVRIQRYGERKKLPKQAGESPSAYVRRVGQHLVEMEILEDDTPYLALAETLDYLFYGKSEKKKEKMKLSPETRFLIQKSLAG